jgi:TRAP-type C4-dicarboxylate transport system substrate-binding protein
MSALTRCLLPGMLTLAIAPPAAAPLEIKLATLVPAHTTWHQALLEMGNTWNKTTNGRVTLTVHPGGEAGTEQSVITQMRGDVAVLQATFVTSVGLAELDESFNVLSLP